MAFTSSVEELIEANQNGLLGKHPSWGRIRLGDCATVQNGAAFKSEYFNTEGRGLPLLRIRDVTRGATETWYDGPYEDDYIVRRGDLVIGMDGDFNHALWAGPDALLNQRVCRLIFKNEGLSKPWVMHILGGYLQAVNDATPSVTVKHLSSGTVADLLLPAPRPEEQASIVANLDELFAAVGEGLRAFAEAESGCLLLRRAGLARLTDATFPRRPLGDISEVFVGATPSRKNPNLWNGDIPWVSSGEVAFCRIQETRETITDEGLGNRATRLHPPGTVLLAMIGEGKTRGQAAILDIPAAHNQNCASIRLDRQQMLPEFLYYSLMEQYERNRQAASGSQQPALNGRLVRELKIPCPSMELQRALIREVEECLSETAALATNLAARSSDAAVLKRSILREALTGHLQPRDDGDETESSENSRAVLVAE